MYIADKNLRNQNIIIRDNGGNSLTSFHTDPLNMDYQRFKQDMNSGVQLSFANNTVMTTEQVAEFLATLP